MFECGKHVHKSRGGCRERMQRWGIMPRTACTECCEAGCNGGNSDGEGARSFLLLYSHSHLGKPRAREQRDRYSFRAALRERASCSSYHGKEGVSHTEKCGTMFTGTRRLFHTLFTYSLFLFPLSHVCSISKLSPLRESLVLSNHWSRRHYCWLRSRRRTPHGNNQKSSGKRSNASCRSPHKPNSARSPHSIVRSAFSR